MRWADLRSEMRVEVSTNDVGNSGRKADNFAVSTWTSTTDLTAVNINHAQNFKASHIPAVYYGTSEKCTASTEDQRLH